MNLQLEKKALKNEIDRVEDESLLNAIKAMLNYAHVSRDIWEEEDFLNELDRRSADFIAGKSKHYTWDEVKARARQELKRKAKQAK